MTKFKALVALLLVTVLLGCAQTPPRNALLEREQLIVDPEVLYGVTVTELFEERVPDDRPGSSLSVQFAVDAHHDFQLAWKVTWFDSAGMKVKGVGESYRKANLLAGQTRHFTAVAPSPRVVTYQLHLREPK